MLSTASVPDVMRLTAFVLLILASGCESKPAGFFAVAGLAVPGLGMNPAGDGIPALPAEWRMPRMPDVQLGMMQNGNGDGAAHVDVIPRTIFDGLGLSIGEHLTWAQPLLMVSIAFEGILGTSCSACNLGMDMGSTQPGLDPMKMSWTICQCTLSAVMGLRTQALKFMLSGSFACLAGIGSITWVCNQFNLHEHGYRLMPMNVTLTMESAERWWQHPLGIALNRMRGVIRGLKPRFTVALVESLQKKGLDWVRYYEGMKRVKDVCEELALEEERNAIMRELNRRRAAVDQAWALANAPAPAPANADAPAPAPAAAQHVDWG